MVQVITVPRPSIWMLSRKPCVSALQAGAQVARLAFVQTAWNSSSATASEAR